MTSTKQTFRPGWQRINDIRAAIFGIPIRQLPEAKRLEIAMMLNDLATYTIWLEDRASLRSHEPPRNSGEGTAVNGPMPLEGESDALE